MQVRDYTLPDQGALLAGADHDLARWQWRQGNHPESGPAPRVVVAAEGAVVHGHLSVARQRLILGGEGVEGALLSSRRSSGSESIDRGMVERLAGQLRAEGVGVWLAAVEPAEVPFFETAGFRFLAEAAARNLYIGLEALSARLSKTALSPLRRFAQEARRIRPKLLEVALDETLAQTFARLSAESPRRGLALEKSAAYWRWRYTQDPRHAHRVLVYRQKAGAGIDAFAVVRRHDSLKGRAVLHVEDYWTREPGRRAHAKLLGDLALLAMTEEIDVLRCFAVSGSSTEQAMLGLGCIRKKVERRLLALPLAGQALPSPFPARDALLTSGDLELY